MDRLRSRTDLDRGITAEVDRYVVARAGHGIARPVAGDGPALPIHGTGPAHIGKERPCFQPVEPQSRRPSPPSTRPGHLSMPEQPATHLPHVLRPRLPARDIPGRAVRLDKPPYLPILLMFHASSN